MYLEDLLRRVGEFDGIVVEALNQPAKRSLAKRIRLAE
jgi:hypothetical protein